MSTWSYLLIPFQNPLLIVLVAIGTFVGIYVAAIPGLTGTMAVALLVSFTYGWNTHSALAIMLGVFMGAAYGGSRSAILLNIPGAPSAVATAFDGYPLALKGQAGKAIGVATVQSCLGGVIGILALMLFTPLISKFAMNFAARDYLMLAFIGMMMVGSMGAKSLTKSLFSAVLGIMLGTVGMDAVTGAQRFTFGNAYLMPGISPIVAMIGLFGCSEALIQIFNKDEKRVKQEVDKIVPSFKSTLKYIPLTLKSSAIGTLVGALPGAGGSIAALLAYDQAKRSTKNPEVPFGEGAIEGLVAPESANNAAVGGACIPMLTLGIPGDPVTAIIMGAMFIHGLQPGPSLMTKTPDLFYLIVMCLLLSCVFMLVFGLTGIKIFTKVVEISTGRLMPIIIVLSAVGAYAINKNLYDVFWMVAFGIIGAVMKRYDYPTAPMVLGIILASMIEKNLRAVLILGGASEEGLTLNLITGIFTNPISLILFLIIVFTILSQTKWYQRQKAAREQKRTARKAAK